MKMRTLFFGLLSLTALSCNMNARKPISPRFNHVMLYVTNLEASIEFYTNAFDLRVTNRLDTLIRIDADGKEVARSVNMAFLKFTDQDFVFELAEHKLDSTSIPVAYLFQHVGVDVLDIDAAFKRAINAGGKELSPIRKVKAKGVEAKQAFIEGPDGERIELMQILEGEF